MAVCRTAFVQCLSESAATSAGGVGAPPRPPPPPPRTYPAAAFAFHTKTSPTRLPHATHPAPTSTAKRRNHMSACFAANSRTTLNALPTSPFSARRRSNAHIFVFCSTLLLRIKSPNQRTQST